MALRLFFNIKIKRLVFILCLFFTCFIIVLIDGNHNGMLSNAKIEQQLSD